MDDAWQRTSRIGRVGRVVWLIGVLIVVAADPIIWPTDKSPTRTTAGFAMMFAGLAVALTGGFILAHVRRQRRQIQA